MSVAQFEDILEACLVRLEAGDSLEEILTSYPEQANDLYSMLAMTMNARQVASEFNIPTAAQNRSRAQFLSAAAGMEPASRKPRFTLAHLRLATSAIIIIGIISAVLFGTGLASAASLPGDVFYPVKLLVEQMQINLVQDPPSRLELQETYDNRRQQEAEQLSHMNRRQQVTFGGFLEQSGSGEWQMGNVTLAFPADFSMPNSLIGAYVQVTGFSDNKMVEVIAIQARQMEWSGILQKFDDQVWLIGGVTLKVNEETHLSGDKPQVGVKAQVTAIRQSGDQYLALDINVAGEPGLARDLKIVTPLTLTPPPVEMASDIREQSTAPAESQPVGLPVPPIVSTAVTPTQNNDSDGKNTMVTRTAANPDGRSQEGDKNTSTPVPVITVSDSDGPSSSPTLTARPSATQKATEKKVATRTPSSNN